MRGRLLGLSVAICAVLPAPASAAPVLVMAHDGRVRAALDRFLGPLPQTPAPAAPGPAVPGASPARARPGHDPRKQLIRLYHRGRITAQAYRQYRRELAAALFTERHLRGTRALELGAIIDNLRQLTAAGLLTPSRLPVLFLTLDRNRQWWRNGPLLSTWQRVEFAGSQLIWEYYPGQGLELQVLGTFGKADALYTAGPSHYRQLRSLLGEMIPLAVRRGGGIAWEYYFRFEGGNPPWVSAMAQGTALEALTRGYEASGRGPASRSPYLRAARSALGLFTTAPPVGIRVTEPRGSRYLQYSFAPATDIINAFLQSLIGLYDYARVSGNPLAARLFAAGDAEARAELPSFDTGAWSLYQPGVEDDLSYHLLVTGFLRQLCRRTRASIYCREARHFRSYLKTPPRLELLTNRLLARKVGQIQFGLSKYSRVGIVLSCHQRTILFTSAEFPYGTGSFSTPPLPAGRCALRLAATDLAGNFSRLHGTITVYRRYRAAHASRHSRRP